MTVTDLYEYDKKGIYFIKSKLSSRHTDVLLSLCEQGASTERDSAFFIEWENVVLLDENLKSFLCLPQKFDGKLFLNFKSMTYSDKFSVDYGFYQDREEIYPVVKGAIIKVRDELYLMDKILYKAVDAINSHKDLKNKTEEDNLLLIYTLKQAFDDGLNIDLHHFKNFQFVVPRKVSLFIEQDSGGNLILTPNFGIAEDPSDIRKRLHQIHKNVKSASIRNKNNIVILDENKRKAVEEIIKTTIIDKTHAKDFLENPSSYIDDNLVDLENGFSARVVGLTEFAQAYFGDQEKQGNNWFDYENNQQKIQIHEVPYAKEIINNIDDLEDFSRKIKDAEENKNTTITFKGKVFNISNKDDVESILKECHEKFALDEGAKTENLKKLVLDIQKNDLSLDYKDNPDDVGDLYSGEIDKDEYSRPFYEHQNIGIRWILAHALQSLDDKPQGCLLADDMGLGKTYMTLVAVREYIKQYYTRNNIRKPVLIVAPVSLLENWKNEILESYQDKFFDNIILLTSGIDLDRYKKNRKVKELTFYDDDTTKGLTDVRYALKIGEQYGLDRLDMPNNIVITNYDTLRSYQASFALVDWSVVVFDEIQYIKNPNTRASIAAKALKANFKLAVTGTPVENSLKDIWNIFDIVNSGLLYEYQKFREKFIAPTLNADSQTKFEIGTKLRTLIGHNMLRRNKEDCLPGITKKNVYSGCLTQSNATTYDAKLSLDMSPEQEEAYGNVLNEYQEKVNKKGFALSTLQKLRLVSLYPALIDESYEADLSSNIEDIKKIFSSSSKLTYLINQLNEIKLRDEKVIIFMINKKLQSVLRNALSIMYNLDVRIINGDTSTTSSAKKNPSREKIIKEFSNKEGFNIIIMSPIAAGVGLTITSANNVIHLERHWNPAKESQATDRVYRIGQTKDVNIYIPVCKYSKGKSFDEILDSLLSKKIDLNKSIITPSEFTEENIAEVVYSQVS